MKRNTLVMLLVGAMILATTAFAPRDKDPKLKKIFNGNNFDGWKVPDNNIWWSIKDGVLSAQSGTKKKGSILWTHKSYKNFIVQADFKMGEGTVDSGIFIRTEKQQIQIGISGSLKRDMTCSPYIPGKGYPVEASNIKKLLKIHDWNTIRVKAVKGQYTVWLNGEQVLNYLSDTAIDEGPIGLQLHPGKEMHIDFRNILLTEL